MTRSKGHYSRSLCQDQQATPDSRSDSEPHRQSTSASHSNYLLRGRRTTETKSGIILGKILVIPVGSLAGQSPSRQLAIAPTPHTWTRRTVSETFVALTLTVDGGCDATSAENQDILPGNVFQKIKRRK
jgi:hypothetical protein